MDNLRRGILLFTAFLFLSIVVIGFVLALNYYDTAAVMESVPDWHYDGEKVTEDDGTGSSGVNENVLVIIGDEGVENSEIMFVSNYDSVDKTITFMYIPKNMKYSLNVRDIPGGKFSGKSSYNTGTMSQLYSRFGGEFSADILSYMFDITIDNYVFLSFNDCKTLFNGFTGQDKGLLFNFPVKVSNVEMNVSLEAGEQYFDGDMAVDLLRFWKTSDNEYDNTLMQYYDGTDLKRIEMVKEFTNTFMKSQLVGSSVNKYYINNFSKIAYDTVIKNCDTNISGSFVLNVQNTIGNMDGNSVTFYVLDSKVSASDVFLCEYNGCFKDITSDDSSKYKSLSKDDTLKAITEKFE